ncbi:hypothetical protein SLS58_007524 [Diplodia intermedia]|uniref:Uncharacterized protein n=1 Tax=Diplodia intermedia TaxID=856260 RepID=A0ABR3TJT5_9PEZI
MELFAGEHLGGHLSQTSAKAIDFVCGAVFAPLLMVPLNYIWFGKARTNAVNEQKNRRGVPLSVLVEASSTSSGTYDMVKLYTLFTGQTWRLLLLGLITILAAVSKTSFANLIAYESYTEEVPSPQPMVLRMLQDSRVIRPNSSFVPENLDVYGFDVHRQSDMASQVITLLNSVDTEPAFNKLDHGIAYIGINATTRSMEDIPENISSLQEVPAYRLTTNCAAGAHNILSAAMDDPYITVMDNDDGFSYHFPRPLSESNFEQRPFGFSAFSHSDVFLGFIFGMETYDTWNLSKSIPSPFGELEIMSLEFVISPTFAVPSEKNAVAWGVRCSILRQEGTLNYTRSSKTGQSGWKIIGASFSNIKHAVPSFLSEWQTNLNYRAPNTSVSGIGPALARTGGIPNLTNPDGAQNNNWTTFIANFLYASAETERLTYEAAASSNSDGSNTSYFYPVSASSRAQFYRITYIPVILLLGLLCAFLAALITGASKSVER